MENKNEEVIQTNAIEFTILSNAEIEGNKKLLLTKPKALAKAISNTINVDEQTVEIYQLLASQDGIKVGFKVHAINYDIHSMIDDLIEDETRLKLLITNYWSLKQFANISNIKEGLMDMDATKMDTDAAIAATYIPLNRMHTMERMNIKANDPQLNSNNNNSNNNASAWQQYMNHLQQYAKTQMSLYEKPIVSIKDENILQICNNMKQLVESRSKLINNDKDESTSELNQIM
eukprot:98704_1